MNLKRIMLSWSQTQKSTYSINLYNIMEKAKSQGQESEQCL